MSYNFDFELPDFSNINLTGLPSNLNLGPLGTSGASTMDSPPQQIDAAVDAALSRLIAQYVQSGENPYISIPDRKWNKRTNNSSRGPSNRSRGNGNNCNRSNP